MSIERFIAHIRAPESDSNRFSMTLATEGEAFDGDILSIDGGIIPERMPLLPNHENDVTRALGSIVDCRKCSDKDKIKRLDATGEIETEGPNAVLRADVLHMIREGHINAVSIRWWPTKWRRRTDLPSDHPAYVDAESTTGPERWGYFYDEWRALEGSVVAVGADPQALIGRADSTEGDVAEFWRGMAKDAQPVADRLISPALRCLALELDRCRKIGMRDAELATFLAQQFPDVALESVLIGEETLYVPAAVADELTGLRAAAAPTADPPDETPEDTPAERSEAMTPETIERMGAILDEWEQRQEQRIDDIVNALQGKVTP